MRRLNRNRTVIVVLLFLFATGCASSPKDGNTENGPIDIRWLTIELQDQGIFVTERGQPEPILTSSASGRLVLNSLEYLDVYEFEQADRARIIAAELVGLHPLRDIYQKESMVVVRRSRRDTGLNGVLYRLLGPAL